MMDQSTYEGWWQLHVRAAKGLPAQEKAIFQGKSTWVRTSPGFD